MERGKIPLFFYLCSLTYVAIKTMGGSYLSLGVDDGCFVCYTNTCRIGEMTFIGLRPLIDKGVDHITVEMRKKMVLLN